MMFDRPVSHDEARRAAQRLINSHFRKPNAAKCTVPTQPDDDDVLICDYIEQQRRKDTADEGTRKGRHPDWRSGAISE